MKKILLLSFLSLTTAVAFGLTPETKAAADRALAQGIGYLKATQSEDGSWSDRRFPGMSALALWALTNSKMKDVAPNAERAAKYIASCSQADGGIYVPIPDRRGGGLGNYNTCLCLTALYTSEYKSLYLSQILAARAYVASTQLAVEGLHEGGFGYDKSSPRAYTDLNNTMYAIDAMTLTRGAEEARPAGEKRVDINWAAAKKYVLSMQEQTGEEAGGFVYNREVPKTTRPGVKQAEKLRSFGSMTYAGLLAMLHCQLSRDDPRVRSTYQYLGKHWSLDENPGQGNQGLYFYYEILARALDAASVSQLTLADDSAIDWREELAKALIKRQQQDGSWVNESNRFWEADPVLSTSYALLALELTLK